MRMVFSPSPCSALIRRSALVFLLTFLRPSGSFASRVERQHLQPLSGEVRQAIDGRAPDVPVPCQVLQRSVEVSRVLRGRLTSRRQSISRRAILGTRSKLRCNKTAKVDSSSSSRTSAEISGGR